MSETNDKYCHGYRSCLKPDQKKTFSKLYAEKSMWKGVLWTSAYLFSIYALIGIVYWVYGGTGSTGVACGVAAISVLLIARQMRGLENIVHFGSHSNFSRQKRLNDTTTNLLAAWPMMQGVSKYRIFHMAHHGDYGSHTDPCRQRLESIGADCSEIRTNLQLLLVIFRWMPEYVREYYNEVKSNSSQTAIFVAWHGSVGVLIAFILSIEAALFATGFWMLIMFGILPFLRGIAEFSEHDYELGKSVSETTFNNLGLLDHLLLHPAAMLGMPCTIFIRPSLGGGKGQPIASS